MEHDFTISRLPEDDSIIRIKLFKSAWEPYHEALDEIMNIVSQSDKRFDLILEVPPTPSPGLPLSHFRRTGMQWSKHHNLMSFTIVGLNRSSSNFMSRLAQIVLNIFLPPIMRNVFYTDTVEEALDQIKIMRETETVSSVAS